MRKKKLHKHIDWCRSVHTCSSYNSNFHAKKSIVIFLSCNQKSNTPPLPPKWEKKNYTNTSIGADQWSQKIRCPSETSKIKKKINTSNKLRVVYDYIILYHKYWSYKFNLHTISIDCLGHSAIPPCRIVSHPWYWNINAWIPVVLENQKKQRNIATQYESEDKYNTLMQVKVLRFSTVAVKCS